METIEKVFKVLSKSAFRRIFKLYPDSKDYIYLKEHGLTKVLQDALALMQTKLIPAIPKNDGKQCPYDGHPVFVAQHATGTCCRTCLFKIHKIQKFKILNDAEIQYILTVFQHYFEQQLQFCKTAPLITRSLKSTVYLFKKAREGRTTVQCYPNKKRKTTCTTVQTTLRQYLLPLKVNNWDVYKKNN